MSKLTTWIKGHQIAAFYIITFAISWGLAFTFDAIYRREVYLLMPLASIAICGPALAGIIISAVSGTQPKQGKRGPAWIAFFVAWLVSACVFLANAIFFNNVPFSPGLVIVTLLTVIPVAFVISMAWSRIPAVKSFLSSLIRLRGVWGWMLLALVLFPAMGLLTNLVSGLVGRQPAEPSQVQATGLTLVGLIAVKFSYQIFFYNSTGEEIGWRGFALPRLQARLSPVIASLVVAFFWVPWHFFVWQAEGSPVTSAQYWVVQYALHFGTSVIFGWFYNRSRGSILIAGVAHAAANTTAAFVPDFDWTLFAFTLAAVALVMVIVDGMWRKLPSDHPAVHHEAMLNGETSNRAAFA